MQYFLLCSLFFLPLAFSANRPKVDLVLESQPVLKATPMRSQTSTKNSHKKNQVAQKKGSKNSINDKTGNPIRTISSIALKHKVNEQLQPLLSLCARADKTTQQKIALFIKQLHKIRAFVLNEEADNHTLEMQDRTLLISMRYQLDSFLEHTKDFSKKGHSIGAVEMRQLFEHTYLSNRNVADGVSVSSIAPDWVTQILASLSCLNQAPHATKKET